MSVCPCCVMRLNFLGKRLLLSASVTRPETTTSCESSVDGVTSSTGMVSVGSRIRMVVTTRSESCRPVALDTLDAYAMAPAQDRDFGSVPIARSVLAVARVSQGQVDGAAEALAPVLDLPPSQRIHQIVISVERVRSALSAITGPGRDAVELAGAIEGWAAERLTQH